MERFTIYDVMDKKGLFKSNPANAGALNPTTGESVYAGPVKYPKMFYHPKGETRITVPAEEIATPFGPKRVGEKRELLCQIVNNEDQERALRADGWWDHPAKAIAAGGGVAPPMGSEQRIEDLEKQIAELKAEKAAAESVVSPAKSAAAKQPAKAGALA